MQNLLSDIHPEFAVPEFAYIAAFDIEANGYDSRVGPCCNKRILDDPQAHRSGWVPLEEIREEDLHPDVFMLQFEEVDDDFFDDDFEYSRPEPDPFCDQYSQMWERYGFIDEEDTVAPKVSADEIDEPFDMRNYDTFPGVIGAHKFVELRHRKVCMLKKACRLEESHGRHGRKKLFWWSTLARENSGKRELPSHTLTQSD